MIKQRTARPGQGKSGGYRTIIAYRRGDRAVFLFGFAKSERANLDDDELSYLRRIGRSSLSLDDDELETAIAAGDAMEITMAKKSRVKPELRGRARLRSEIVEAMRGLHKIGIINNTDLEKTTLRMLGRDALPKVTELSPTEIARVREQAGV